MGFFAMSMQVFLVMAVINPSPNDTTLTCLICQLTQHLFEGKSIYFDAKEDVINYLEKNKDKKSIDVGCMQINTKYHMSNFSNFAQMIEPKENVKYAAIFLSKLFKRHKSWNEAISRYHSSNPHKQKKYLKKVYSFWNNLRQKKIIVKTGFVEKNKHEIEIFKNILEKERI